MVVIQAIRRNDDLRGNKNANKLPFVLEPSTVRWAREPTFPTFHMNEAWSLKRLVRSLRVRQDRAQVGNLLALREPYHYYSKCVPRAPSDPKKASLFQGEVQGRLRRCENLRRIM